MLIYKITNKLNLPAYVGKTTKTLEERMRGHLYNKRHSLIDEAIQEFGIENFTITIIAECQTKEELDLLERKFIHECNCVFPNGYNLIGYGIKSGNRTQAPSSRIADIKEKIDYIQSRQGQRARVIYEPVGRNIFLIGGIESFKEAATRNKFKHHTQVTRFDRITADKDLAEKTGFPVGAKLYDVRRVRYLNDKPLILDKNLFLISAVGNLNWEIATQSIYEYLETVLKMKIVTRKRRMTVELATSEDKEWLELDDYNCLAVLSGRVFNSDGIQFEYTESRHHPNYFCFEDTATRNKKRFL